MRLETLPGKRLIEMSHEELLEEIRRIREGRVTPNPTQKTAAKKRSIKRTETAEELFAKMSPAEREDFVKRLMGK